MYSSLTDGYVWSPNCNSPRNDQIRKIIIHHMAATWSAQRCGESFADPTREGSSNYGIGMNGEIYCYVQEEDRAWTSGSRWADNQAITIECANDEMGGQWHVSNETLDSCINLCVDICRRYGFRLEWTGDENGSLAVHRFFEPTDCPGEYLFGLMPWIAKEVNNRLDGGSPSFPSDYRPNNEYYGSSIKDVQRWLNDKFSTDIDEDGIYGPRTQMALVKAFQIVTCCGVDGIFGNECRDAANRNLLKNGSNGTLVRTWQGALICLGYDPSGFDGIFGNGCENATRLFQSHSGLDVDGIVGGNTFYTALNRYSVGSALDEPPVQTDPEPESQPEPTIPSYANNLVSYGQQWINDTYGYGIAVDGIWGNETRTALVKAFQAETGCVVDGIWGDECREAAARNAFTVDAFGPLVRVWQATLACKNYNPNGIDGIFGGGCLSATKNIQIDLGVGADGWVGVDTWSAAIG